MKNKASKHEAASNSSYLQRYLNKRNSEFNKIKAKQDKKDNDTQKEIREMSKALLAQIHQQKRELLEDGQDLPDVKDDFGGNKQFEMIEGFLLSLANENGTKQEQTD